MSSLMFRTGLEGSFVSRRVSVANPHGVGADEWAHIHVWL